MVSVLKERQTHKLFDQPYKHVDILSLLGFKQDFFLNSGIASTTPIIEGRDDNAISTQLKIARRVYTDIPELLISRAPSSEGVRSYASIDESLEENGHDVFLLTLVCERVIGHLVLTFVVATFGTSVVTRLTRTEERGRDKRRSCRRDDVLCRLWQRGRRQGGTRRGRRRRWLWRLSLGLGLGLLLRLGRRLSANVSVGGRGRGRGRYRSMSRRAGRARRKDNK